MIAKIQIPLSWPVVGGNNYNRESLITIRRPRNISTILYPLILHFTFHLLPFGLKTISKTIAWLYTLKHILSRPKNKVWLSMRGLLLVSKEYAPQDLYNHTVASGHSFDVLAIDRFLVIN
jgi:hypothetical protein